MEPQKVDYSKVVELAKQIIELDLKRDEKWEVLTQLAGNRAFEVLRRVQNS
ncbi:hypothetical protein [Priestia koreensis]|uniref:hypothetical protein n=1 Tax=Priestia koreensis TaxID=284581 RepID=UPI000A612063|nr:hypothetical protein IE339_15975 [Priestia koreensis]